MIKRPFDECHAGIESQILNLSAGVQDSDEVLAARNQDHTADNLLVLGNALSRQLRYREAIEAYTKALELQPDNLLILRLRAGRYLTTLQNDLAIQNFEECLNLGADQLDCLYRIGLAHYYAGRYRKAAEIFKTCISLCDDEMGIAVIYWHTLSSRRAGMKQELLNMYHTDMAVGHHVSYEKAVQVWTGKTSLPIMLETLRLEKDDLEYCITMYGLICHPYCVEKELLQTELLRRDGFWPGFAYLAAWNDCARVCNSERIEHLEGEAGDKDAVYNTGLL